MMFLKSITFWTLLIVHNTGASPALVGDPCQGDASNTNGNCTEHAECLHGSCICVTNYVRTQARLCTATSTPAVTIAPVGAGTQAPEALEALFGDPCGHDESNPKGLNCTENAECSQGLCACVVGYVSTHDRHCKMAVGHKSCTSQPNSCGDHAHCIYNNTTPNISECQCESRYYASDNGTCEDRILLGEHCEPLEGGKSPCIQPEATACHNNTCDCSDDFLPSNRSTCSSRLQVGAYCGHITDGTNPCVGNANCTANVCKCHNTHYEDSSHHCQERIVPEKVCDPQSPVDNQCIEGAVCHPSGVCRCIEYLYRYKPDTPTCEQLKEHGQPCDNANFCVDDTVCADGFCACPSDHFYNSTILHCQIRKPAGAACHALEECVENAACVEHRCLCDIHHYEYNQQCYPRERLGHQCDSSRPNQCLINGECVNELCQCNNKSYNNEDFSCPLTLGFNEACNWENQDPRQCVSNTTCIFRPVDSMPACGCDRDHFFNGLHCIKRALAGESCPYYSADSYGLHMPLEEFNNQCVEHAVCNDRKVCECDSDYYDKAGHCPPRIQLHQICDPWRDYPHQCANNAHCLYGRCV